jgi:RimJ/RimL family protein N-acetyltransferase
VIIERVAAEDDAAFAEWFRPFHASELATWPGEPGWAEHELQVLYRDQSDSDIVIAVARDDDGSAIGCLDVSMPKRESLHVAYMLVAVDPAHWGRGVGRALVEHGEQIARQSGRMKVIGRTDEPLQETESRGSRFARAAGYTAGRADARRELRLPMAPGRLDALEAACLPFANGYEIVTWTERCPEVLADGRVYLSRIISADAPRGELDYEEEDWDLPRLRNWERNVAKMDRHLLAAGAVEVSSGALVGFTEVGLPRRQPEVAYQFDTVVSAAHRGRRLGMLVKVANMRALLELSPATSRILTWNAVENEPMIRLNEAMGFELVGIGTGWQKDLS